MRKEAEENKEQNIRLNLAVYSSEVEQLKLEVRDLYVQNQLLKATKEADVTELKTNMRALKEKEAIISVMREQLTKAREHLSS